MEDIFKKPEVSPCVSFYLLQCDGKSKSDIHKYIDTLIFPEDLEMFEAIFKRCEYRECRVRVGKILYYRGF